LRPRSSGSTYARLASPFPGFLDPRSIGTASKQARGLELQPAQQPEPALEHSDATTIAR